MSLTLYNTMGATSNNEWNDLMEHFVDVSQDELTKNMNDYVKSKRWCNAVSRFGLHKLVVGSNASTAELTAESHHDEITVERTDSAFEEDTGDQFPARDATSGDLGELVESHQSYVPTERVNDVAGAMDDNLARIMKGRMKRHVEPSSWTPASKKKSRRKKQMGISSNIDELMCNEDGKRLRCNSVDGARSAQDIVVGAGSSLLDEVEPNDAHSARRRNLIAESFFNDNNEDMAIPPNYIGADEKCPTGIPRYLDSSERKKIAKTKSKSGKKSKRLSASVIDDIFKR